MLYDIAIGNKRRGDTGAYVGRPSVLGNPYLVGVHGAAGECIAPYRVWLWEQMQDEKSAALAALREILGAAREAPLTLVCWCHPAPCHAEVIRDALVWLDEKERAKDAQRLDDLGVFGRLSLEIEGAYR